MLVNISAPWFAYGKMGQNSGRWPRKDGHVEFKRGV